MLGSVGEGLVELGLEPASGAGVTLGYGGDAANAATMAALLGTPSRIGGRVGDDALGHRLLGFWRDVGVDTSWVTVDPGGPTGIYVNERGAEGLHRFDYHRRLSAGSRLEPDDLEHGFLDGLGVLHVTGVTLAVSDSSARTAARGIAASHTRGIDVSLAVNHRPALGGDVAALREAAARAAIVFCSTDELRPVFGVDDLAGLERALPTVREVVLTQGDRGAAVLVGGALHEAGPHPVRAVDSTGAGDALAGAYLAARLAGRPPADALRLGVTAAGLSCRARGCALSYPSRDEVEAALERAGIEGLAPNS